MKHLNASRVVVTGVVAGVLLAVAVMAGAQPVTPPAPRPALNPPGPTSPSGAFQRLSPGNQKIASALFEAQQTSPSGKALTLDQIAAMKGKRGWGEVFKDMKGRGLVQDKNLGQAVNNFERKHGKEGEKKQIASTRGRDRDRDDRKGGSRHGEGRSEERGFADRPDHGFGDRERGGGGGVGHGGGRGR